MTMGTRWRKASLWNEQSQITSSQQMFAVSMEMLRIPVPWKISLLVLPSLMFIIHQEMLNIYSTQCRKTKWQNASREVSNVGEICSVKVKLKIAHPSLEICWCIAALQSANRLQIRSVYHGKLEVNRLLIEDLLVEVRQTQNSK